MANHMSYYILIWSGCTFGESRVREEIFLEDLARQTLIPMFDSNKYKKLLLEASDLHLRFHDQAWQIWSLLGGAPQTLQ